MPISLVGSLNGCAAAWVLAAWVAAAAAALACGVVALDFLLSSPPPQAIAIRPSRPLPATPPRSRLRRDSCRYRRAAIVVIPLLAAGSLAPENDAPGGRAATGRPRRTPAGGRNLLSLVCIVKRST